MYFLNDDGVMNVVKPGPKFERVARNELGEKTFGSPAISQGYFSCAGRSICSAFKQKLLAEFPGFG